MENYEQKRIKKLKQGNIRKRKGGCQLKEKNKLMQDINFCTGISKNKKGVTLVALVVTIVVLLILAGVSIGMLAGDNGLIKQAQNASDEWKIAQDLEQLELAKQAEIAKGGGYIDVDDYFQRLEDEGIVNDKDADIVDNGDGTYDVTTENGNTFEVTPVPDEENAEDIEIDYVGQGEIVGPRINKIEVTDKTETSISVEVTTRNAEGGNYTYSYKKATDSSYTQAQTTANNTYTFTNLEENTKYDIKVKLETSEGSIEKTITVQTEAEKPPEEETPVGTITFGTVTWSGGNASIQVNTTSGYGMEYQINGTTEGSWTSIANNGTIQNLTHGNTVNVRLVNGSKRGEVQSTTIKDETVPKVTVSQQGSATTNSIAVSVQATDNESGMSTSPTYTYFIKKTSEGSYTQKASNANNSYTFTGLDQETSYDIKVEVQGDKAGNKGEGTLTGITTGKVTGGTVEGAITFGNPTWSAGQASITISTNTSYKIEYQLNGTTGSWTEISNNGTIQNLAHNTTIYARLTDGNNHGDYTSTNIQDTVNPTVEVTQQGSATTNSITVNVEATDNESGMNTSPTYTYFIKKTSEGSYTQKASNANNSYTFTGLDQETSYDIKVEVQGDKAGNKGEGTLTGITTGKVTGGTEQGAITFGNPTWSDGQASITISTNTSYKIEYQLNGTEGNWTEISNNGTIQNLAHNTTIYARLTDGNNHGDYTSTTIQDTVNPKVEITRRTTTNSITVTVQATDNESGMADSVTYTYYIKKSTEQNYTQETSNTTNSYTFTGLGQGTTYDIKVEVQGDKAGNKGEGTITNVTTGEITGGTEEGAITFGSPTWKDGQASITISTNTSYKIEYQLNGIAEGSWTEIANNGTISNLAHNTTIYARLTDGNNHGDYTSINIKDTVNPTVEVTQQGSATTNSIEVTVQATDNESGMSTSPTYTYFIKKTSENDYQQKASNANNSYTFTELDQETSYDIKVEVQGDKAGNKGEGTLTGITTGKVTGGTVEGAITFGNPTWSAGQASITISTNTSYKIEYQLNGTTGSWTEISNNGTIQNLAHNTTIYARLTDGNNHGDYTSTNIQDTVNPTVEVTQQGSATTNSITVNVEATDNESGMNTSPTYTYFIKKTSEGSYTQKASNANNSYTFTGLDQETSYDIKVEVQGDKAGNKGEGTLTGITTGKVTGGTVEGAITFGNPTWSDGQASITVSTNTSYKIEYQLNGTEGNWTEIANNGTIQNIPHNTTIYARLTDGNNHGEHASTTIKDTVNPTVTIQSLTAEDTTIQVTAKGTDNETGINEYIFYIKESTQEDSSYQEKTRNNTGTATIEGLETGKTYTVKVEVTDKAGLTGNATKEIEIKKPQISNEDISNNPEEYFGGIVSNYDSPTDAGINWQIFHADEENIYLIADYYLEPYIAPDGSHVGHGYHVNPGFAIGYGGSENITDEKIKALNNDYFNVKGYKSTSEAMQGVAYMLDINQWSKFAGEQAEYAIGGPTIELLFESYNKRYSTGYTAEATSDSGYIINSDLNWDDTDFNELNTTDGLYVLPPVDPDSFYDVESYWIASPANVEYRR